MKKKYNILLVGFGYWGPILARNFQSNLNFKIYSVCDTNKNNLRKAKNIYSNYHGWVCFNFNDSCGRS